MSQRLLCALTAVCIVMICIVIVVTCRLESLPQVAVSAQEAPPRRLQISELVSEQVSESLFKVEQSSLEEEQDMKRASKTSESTLLTVSKPFTTYLLIMIPILPKSFHSREMIRNTWYKDFSDSKDVMLRFAMGTAGLDDTNVTNLLATENSTHGDLIYFDKLKENRTVLTNKTLLLMQWAYSNVNFSYLLKCDDDTFVFVERTIKELKKRRSATKLYYGKFKFSGPLKTSGVWKDTSWKLGNTYLPFALGGGYILSSDLIMLIIESIDYLEWHPNEDTAVGSWLAPYKFERRNDKLICMSIHNWKAKDCQKNFIMHLFYGINSTSLDEIFYTYNKERSVS